MSDELKECPFCGYKSIILEDFDKDEDEIKFYPICRNPDCFLYGEVPLNMWYYEKDDAISAWNKRNETT